MTSDLSVGGDPLAYPHLLPTGHQQPVTVAEYAALAHALTHHPGTVPTPGRAARVHTSPSHTAWLVCWPPGHHTHGTPTEPTP